MRLEVGAERERSAIAALRAAIDTAATVVSVATSSTDRERVADALGQCSGHLLAAAITTSDRHHERRLLAVRDEISACLLAAQALDEVDCAAAACRLRGRAVDAVVSLGGARPYAGADGGARHGRE